MNSYSLTQQQKQQVIEKTQSYIALANQLLELNLPAICIKFDLKGRSSGMFMVRPELKCIRYNEIIFSQYYADALVNTVAHEVAHYVVNAIWGLRKVKPHGKEWQHIMQLFQVKAEVTSNYDVSRLPLRQQQRFEYNCGCMSHRITTTRHNKIVRNKVVYCCRLCRQPLKKSLSME